ncbi:MAG: anaerobic ribonucleoside-triphosphate reductase activating protein [Alphaproteobacteria bacterium]|nr:anaerobic ribonucleoside-triphosphate reductase activating protein [Alphaproteobacteria bacterium]MBL0717792.1 anaerobic ribonucleoside-triphosphate reductase activating protein [Alphaproteobacteria bacterium]
MTFNIFNHEVVIQEVPNEISLSFSVVGCTLNCPGCSWEGIRKNEPYEELTDKKYIDLLEKYRGLCSCVLFYGGEWHEEKLKEFLILAKDYDFKTCLYTGLDEISLSLMKHLDYLKTGPYIEAMGGLDSATTNQKFYDLTLKKSLNHYFLKKSIAKEDKVIFDS